MTVFLRPYESDPPWQRCDTPDPDYYRWFESREACAACGDAPVEVGKVCAACWVEGE